MFLNASDSLTKQRCRPCEKGGKPLPATEVARLRGELNQMWAVEDDKKLRAHFSFDNFREVMSFANKVAALAEYEGHHPDLHLSYHQATVELWTHAVGGLTENDFILAAKIESLA